MGLVRGMTSLNTRSRKRKVLSVKQREDIKIEVKQYNKRMRQKHLHNLQMTVDEYIDYVQGYHKPRSTNQVVKKAPAPMPKVRQTPIVPSMTSNKIPGNSGTKRNWKEEAERIEISKQYSIVPAYNKGPYMVVPKSELKTAGKKV
jgi:hypothetical protein